MLSPVAVLATVAAAATARADAPSGKGLAWETRTEASAYQDSDAVTVLTPAVHAKVHDPLAGWSVDASYLADIVSAASVDIVSTASPNWRELRHAATLGAAYETGTLGGALSSEVSSEPDYLSLSASARATSAFARKNVTLGLGYSFTRDTAGRTGTPFSVYSLELDRHRVSGSLELVLDRATTLTTSLDVTHEAGRQEKPYRYLPLFDAATASRVPRAASVEVVHALRLGVRMSERLPDTRERIALSGRLAHRFRSSTLLLLDRAYLDDWGLQATTLDVRYVLELGRRWSLWPHARGHVQSGVSFWRRAYAGALAGGIAELPRWRTGDRELGPLVSATLGPGVRWDFGVPDPRAFSAIVEVETTYTRYADALYIDERWAGFASFRFETRF